MIHIARHPQHIIIHMIPFIEEEQLMLGPIHVPQPIAMERHQALLENLDLSLHIHNRDITMILSLRQMSGERLVGIPLEARRQPLIMSQLNPVYGEQCR